MNVEGESIARSLACLNAMPLRLVCGTASGLRAREGRVKYEWVAPPGCVFSRFASLPFPHSDSSLDGAPIAVGRIVDPHSTALYAVAKGLLLDLPSPLSRKFPLFGHERNIPDPQNLSTQNLPCAATTYGSAQAGPWYTQNTQVPCAGEGDPVRRVWGGEEW